MIMGYNTNSLIRKETGMNVVKT